ncbi:MAG TPA: hypothetical protein VFN67_13735 [Polyangiales bacterium]|nr:hypothetical protein [Polyangiales bacterium]
MLNQQGYFARLIDRALERGPALTPRRAARFEPTQLQSPAVCHEDGTWYAAQPTEPQLSAAVPQVQGQMSAAPEVALAAPVTRPELADPESARASVARSALSFETVLRPASAGTSVSAHAVHASLTHEHTLQALEGVSQQPGGDAVSTRAPEGPRPALRHLRPPTSSATPMVALARRAEPQARAAAVRVLPEARGGQRQAAEQRAQPAAAAPYASFETAALDAPSTPEPRVTIHIGRIEVRARMERPQPKAAAQTNAPRLGLEEYLRRQETRR